MENKHPNLDAIKKLCERDYQTMFWIPIIYQTTMKAEGQIEEMLSMINEFHEKEDQKKSANRNSVILRKPGAPIKRRQQILGDMHDAEAVTTRVEVVLKSESTKFAILSVLKRHFLFSQLHDYELEDVIDSMQSRTAVEREVIIREGEPGDVFYVLEEGRCQISIGSEVLGELQEGSSFGDLALMYNCPRAATITALTDCVLWTLDRVFFRQAMVTSSSNQNVQLSQFLSKIVLFESLSVQSLNQLARSLTKQTYDDGDYIIRQGEIGEQFYVLSKGTVKVTMMGDNGEETELVQLHEGDVFGERALIRKEPRAANIIAMGPCECYFLNKHDFSSMLGELVDKLNELNEFRVLRSAHIFHQLSDSRLKALKTSFYLHTMFKGQRLVCDPINIYVIMDGQVESLAGTRYGASSFIGDLSRGADDVAGSLTAISDEVKIIYLERQILQDRLTAQEEDAKRDANRRQSHFSVVDVKNTRGSVVGSPEDQKKSELLLEKTKKKRLATAEARRRAIAGMQCNSLEPLLVIQPLGRGTFGSVYLAKHRHSGKFIALKCLDKQALMNSSQHQYVQREVIALQTFNHPFLGAYFGAVVSPRKVFFVLEFISGGELWSYLYRDPAVNPVEECPKPGPYGGIEVNQAALYAAIVAMALEHIHDQGYCYRDLKPENLMITSSGYLKIVDFGFAKPVPFMNKSQQIQYRTYTLCGTPDYMSPEVVLTQGHDGSADYWAYGVLVYELLCGGTPFEGKNQQRTFEKIVHSQKYLSFPGGFDPHSKSLIRKLLHPNPALRLGALQNGFDDIKTHAFFTTQGVNFNKLLAQEITMPYIPKEFTPNPSKLTSSDIEPIDLEVEAKARVEKDFGEFFNQLLDAELE